MAPPTLPPRIPIAGGRRRARVAEGRDWPKGGRGRVGGGACPPRPIGGRERLRRARGRHEVPAGSGERGAAGGSKAELWDRACGAGAGWNGLVPRSGEPRAPGLARRVRARGEQRRRGGRVGGAEGGAGKPPHSRGGGLGDPAVG